MSMKKKAIMAASYVMVAALAIGGTVAYLTDQTDVTPNVMTMGNISIEQLEYERVVDANGNWVAADEKYAATFGEDTYKPDAMQEFTQGKVAIPAVYVDKAVKWDDRNGGQNSSGTGSHQQSWKEVGAPGSNQLFDDSVTNVIDKFVFVKNTGNAETYYRTIIAIECPDDETAALIHSNFNGNARFDYDTTTDGIQDSDAAKIVYATIDKVRYVVYTATYTEALAAGEVSRPSLLQVFLDPTADNDDVAKFGNSWEILTMSQAVQVTGEGAATALDTAFGEVNADNAAKWFAGVVTVAAPESGAVRPAGMVPQDGVAIDGVTIIDNSDDATNLRALYNPGAAAVTEDMVITNSYLDGTYAMNVYAVDGSDAKLLVSDSTLKGWVSYDGFASASFTDCTFDMNSSAEYYKTVRPYAATTFTNCDFAEGYEFWLDKLDGAKITLKNCTLNGVKITSADQLNIVYGDATSVVIDNK